MQAEILVPLDGSLVAETVLPPALALAGALGGSLTLLRVTPPTLAAEPLAQAIQAPVITYRHRAEDRDQADIYLAGVAKRLNRPACRCRLPCCAAIPRRRLCSTLKTRRICA